MHPPLRSFSWSSFRLGLAVALGFLLLATSRAAIAAEPREDHLVFEGAAGFGTPLGWLGGELVAVPVLPLALHAGIGIGSQGAQVTAGARVRYPVGRHDRVGLGASWSSGPFAAAPSDTPLLPEIAYAKPLTYYWDWAHFANAELSFEHREGRTLVRPFLGVGYVLNGADVLVVNGPPLRSEASSRVAARFVPFFGLAVGFGVW